MGYELDDVPLSQIETTDRTYQISTDEDITELALSISAIGLLHPPSIVKKKTSYRVVCGFRRLAACRSLRMETIPVRILPQDLPGEFYTRIAISENALQRSLNIVEQSRAYALILRSGEKGVDTIKIAKSVGLPDNQKALDRIRTIAEMPEYLQRALLDGTIAVPVATELNQWDPKDARLLSYLFQRITPGLNVQRELLTLLSEISLRDDLPIAQLVGGKAIGSILNHKPTSAPQKVQAIRVLLKEMRYPELSERENAYYESLKALKLNSRLQLLPPRFFESNTYRLTISIESRSQLKSILPELKKLIDQPDLLPE